MSLFVLEEKDLPHRVFLFPVIAGQGSGIKWREVLSFSNLTLWLMLLVSIPLSVALMVGALYFLWGIADSIIQRSTYNVSLWSFAALAMIMCVVLYVALRMVQSCSKLTSYFLSHGRVR